MSTTQWTRQDALWQVRTGKVGGETNSAYEYLEQRIAGGGELESRLIGYELLQVLASTLHNRWKD
jgi:hypothetical protein